MVVAHEDRDAEQRSLTHYYLLKELCPLISKQWSWPFA